MLGAGARLAAGGVVENAIVGARTQVGAGASVVGSIVGDDARARRGVRAPQPRRRRTWARVGEGNVLDHGLRVGAGQRIPDEALRFS